MGELELLAEAYAKTSFASVRGLRDLREAFVLGNGDPAAIAHRGVWRDVLLVLSRQARLAVDQVHSIDQPKAFEDFLSARSTPE